jgi:single-strand DNA-binding protein
MNYNKAILIGNIVRDCEQKYTPSGTAIANFSLAVNRKFKQNDEQKDEVSFIDCVAFAKTAELCSQYLGKGSGVLVEGRLKQERWEKDGQQRSRIVVVVESVTFLTKAKQDNYQPAEAQEDSGNDSADIPF